MIHAKRLTKYYQDFCAVDKISFDIRRGEILRAVRSQWRR